MKASNIRTFDPIMDARRLIDIFEASMPKIQQAMIKAFAIPVIFIEGFPVNTFEMRDSKTGKLLAKIVDVN